MEGGTGEGAAAEAPTAPAATSDDPSGAPASSNGQKTAAVPPQVLSTVPPKEDKGVDTAFIDLSLDESDEGDDEGIAEDGPANGGGLQSTGRPVLSLKTVRGLSAVRPGGSVEKNENGKRPSYSMPMDGGGGTEPQPARDVLTAKKRLYSGGASSRVVVARSGGGLMEVAAAGQPRVLPGPSAQHASSSSASSNGSVRVRSSSAAAPAAASSSSSGGGGGARGGAMHPPIEKRTRLRNVPQAVLVRGRKRTEPGGPPAPPPSSTRPPRRSCRVNEVLFPSTRGQGLYGKQAEEAKTFAQESSFTSREWQRSRQVRAALNMIAWRPATRGSCTPTPKWYTRGGSVIRLAEDDKSVCGLTLLLLARQAVPDKLLKSGEVVTEWARDVVRRHQAAGKRGRATGTSEKGGGSEGWRGRGRRV